MAEIRTQQQGAVPVLASVFDRYALRKNYRYNALINRAIKGENIKYDANKPKVIADLLKDDSPGLTADKAIIATAIQARARGFLTRNKIMNNPNIIRYVNNVDDIRKDANAKIAVANRVIADAEDTIKKKSSMFYTPAEVKNAKELIALEIERINIVKKNAQKKINDITKTTQIIYGKERGANTARYDKAATKLTSVLRSRKVRTDPYLKTALKAIKGRTERVRTDSKLNNASIYRLQGLIKEKTPSMLGGLFTSSAVKKENEQIAYEAKKELNQLIDIKKLRERKRIKDGINATRRFVIAQLQREGKEIPAKILAAEAAALAESAAEAKAFEVADAVIESKAKEGAIPTIQRAYKNKLARKLLTKLVLQKRRNTRLAKQASKDPNRFTELGNRVFNISISNKFKTVNGLIMKLNRIRKQINNVKKTRNMKNLPNSVVQPRLDYLISIRNNINAQIDTIKRSVPEPEKKQIQLLLDESDAIEQRDLTTPIDTSPNKRRGRPKGSTTKTKTIADSGPAKTRGRPKKIIYDTDTGRPKNTIAIADLESKVMKALKDTGPAKVGRPKKSTKTKAEIEDEMAALKTQNNTLYAEYEKMKEKLATLKQPAALERAQKRKDELRILIAELNARALALAAML